MEPTTEPDSAKSQYAVFKLMISTGVANKGDCRYIKPKAGEFNMVKLFLNHGRLTSFYYKGLLSLNG